MTTTEKTTVTIGEIVKRQGNTYRVVKIENGIIHAEKLNPKTMQPYKSPLRKWAL